MTSVAVAIQKNAPAVLDLFDEFATDAALELRGALVPYKGDVKFLLARDQNENFGAAISKVLAERQAEIEPDTDEAKALSEELMLGVMADTILLGWEGNMVYQKQPLPYSRENAIKLLKHRDFRAWVRTQSANRDHYRAKVLDEAVKN